jgi:hypothetical protein
LKDLAHELKAILDRSVGRHVDRRFRGPVANERGAECLRAAGYVLEPIGPIAIRRGAQICSDHDDIGPGERHARVGVHDAPGDDACGLGDGLGRIGYEDKKEGAKCKTYVSVAHVLVDHGNLR